MRRIHLLLLSCLWTACGIWEPDRFDKPRPERILLSEPGDPDSGISRSVDGSPREKVILAYQIRRQDNDSLEAISRRFQISPFVLEKFNGVDSEKRLDPFLYVPLLKERHIPFAPLDYSLVKLARDEYMRPVLLGEWLAPEKSEFTNMSDWLTPDDDKRFLFPVEGYVSSRFAWRWNRFHKGIDIAAKIGSPIVAARDGVVAFRGWKPGFGLVVVIQHDEGRTYYAHCQTTIVRAGQWVSRGETIASVGNTGHSYGAHVHFEYRDANNRSIDPGPFMTPGCNRPTEIVSSITFSTGRFAAKAAPAVCLNRAL